MNRRHRRGRVCVDLEEMEWNREPSTGVKPMHIEPLDGLNPRYGTVL